ncbi:hypothetical protein [Brevibacterium oceani]|uniref:hypothetical protein n=1 Tax=Brevibacterium oceani TaxID=358099 RepID=UPI002159F916|nr:hypothetical protein [Brevibacterium oceani]
MSANPPGRGDENEWDVNDRSGSQWPSQATPQSNNGWGAPQPGPQPPHQQSGPAQPQSRPYVQAPHSQSGQPNQRPIQQAYNQGAQPYPQGQQSYSQGQPPHPQTGPQFQQGQYPYQQQASPAPKKRGGLIALFAVVVIVLGVGIGWGAANLFPRGSDDNAAVAPTDEPTGEPTGAGDESAAASEDPEPTETESKLPDDPKEALKQLAATDGKAVTDDLDGKWVPQLSSKKVGLEAEGKTWKEQDILDEHEELREEYPRVRLVWSGDFSSFRESNFWVTVVGIGYSDPEDALSWCSSHGLGPDSCYAKQLNTSGGDEGTTRLQD